MSHGIFLTHKKIIIAHNMNNRLEDKHDDEAYYQDVSSGVETHQTKTAKAKTKTRTHKILALARKRTRLSGRSGRGDSAKYPSRRKRSTKEFFDCIDIISEKIAVISRKADQITMLNDGATLASSETSKFSNDICRLIEDTNGQALECKTLLSSLKEENDKENCVAKKGRNRVKPVELRMREHMVNKLLHDFFDGTKRYQDAQVRYNDDLKEKLTMQIQLIKPGATDHEVDRIMRHEGLRGALFRQVILGNDVNNQFIMLLNTVQVKCQEVTRIERSVAELHQIFLDVASLTEWQGGLLDHFEYQRGYANDYDIEGSLDIYDAILIQRENRKKRMRIFLTVLGVVVLAIAFV